MLSATFTRLVTTDYYALSHLTGYIHEAQKLDRQYDLAGGYTYEYTLSCTNTTPQHAMKLKPTNRMLYTACSITNKMLHVKRSENKKHGSNAQRTR